jgi:hypothetical protein
MISNLFIYKIACWKPELDFENVTCCFAILNDFYLLLCIGFA